MRTMTAFAAALLGATPALAGTLSVQVASGGKPVAAVVSVYSIGRSTPSAKVAGPYKVSQKGMQFHPFISVVPVGAEVSFPNLDTVRHHVYSFSAPKRFELKLYAKDQTRSVRFDKPGIIAVGCNIHDRMSAFIFVADTGWAAITNARGTADFRDLPPGRYTVKVWHPYARAPGNSVEQTIELSADQKIAVPLSLRPPPMHGRSDY